MSGARYPYVVQASLNVRLWSLIGSIAFAALMTWLITAVLLADDDRGFWTAAILAGFFGAMVIGSLWLGAAVWTRRVIFDAAGVSVESVWGRRRFERAWLHGWRSGGLEGDLAIVDLYRKDDPRSFRIWAPKIVDATIEAWFGEARNLEVVETKAALAEIEGDEALGATSEERINATDAEVLFLRRAYWPMLAFTLWVLFAPKPYQVAVGAAIVLPIVIVLVTYLRRGRWRLWAGPNEFRASPSPHIGLCVAAAVLRAFYDWRIIDWALLGSIVVAAGVVIAVLVLVAFGQRFSDRDRVIGAVFGAVAYAYGAVVPLNMWLDDRAPDALRGVVIELDAERVVIAPPPPFLRAIDTEISPRLAERLTMGGEVCIDLYRGAFGVSSYDVRACDT